MSDAIDEYLDQLFDALSGASGRRTLAEAEDHLRTAQAELVTGGVPAGSAAEQAVRRFGEAESLAHAERVVQRDIPGLARQLISGTWILGSLGLIAIGLSGLIAEIMGRVWSAGFVAGDTNGITYTANRCAEYVEYFPGQSCAEAAAMHHWGEVVQYRVAAGALGVLALVVFAMIRRGPLSGKRWAPPRGSIALVGGAVFALAAVATGGPMLVELALGETTGVGANLSAGIVAGSAALIAAIYGYRVRTSAAWPP